MSNFLYNLILNAQNFDEISMETLIDKFSPIINSLSKKLYYEYAKTDLIIYFIELIYKTNFNIKSKRRWSYY